MLFRSRGLLCTATTRQALAQTAGGQKVVTSASPEPRSRRSTLGRSKSPLVSLMRPVRVRNRKQPGRVKSSNRFWKIGRMNSCFKFHRNGWPPGFGLLLDVIDIGPEMQFVTVYDDTIAVSTRGTIICVWNRHILSKFSLTTKSLSESASSSCQRESTLPNQGLSA